jgi:hypothetical protein
MQNPYAGVVMDPDILVGGTQELVYQTVADHVQEVDGSLTVCAYDVAKSLINQLNIEDGDGVPQYVPSDGDEEQEVEKEVGDNDMIESMSVGSAGSYAAKLLLLAEQKLAKEMEEKRKMVNIYYD